MGIGRWLRRLTGRHPASQATVPYLDVESGRIVQIPASELRPGAIQVQMQGTNEVVWALPEHFQQGGIKHGEFEEDIRDYIRQIQAAFAEHRPLSFEEWEEGFRRDATPEREIALWSHAADVYNLFAANEPAAKRRRDIYLCVVACLCTSPESVWQVLRPEALSRAEAEQVVEAFFSGHK